MKTEYKGFDITFRSNGITIDSGRYFVEAQGFNQDGYATLGNAKGAITKNLAAKGIEQRIAYIVAATKPVVQSRNKREGRYSGKKATHVETRAGTIVRKPVKHWRAGPAGLYDDLRSQRASCI